MTANRTGSRNPSKKPTTVAAWKKSALSNEPIEMPSGNFLRIKRVGLQAMMSMGMVPNSLMAFAQKAVAKGEGKQGIDDDQLVDLVQDEEKVREIGRFMDNVACFTAVEPTIAPLPEAGVERDPDQLYVDDVSEEDKMFLFQLATGGTADVESFRAEHAATMAAVRGREDVGLSTQ
jgi:hypothetical protein